jgi:hypothetical protein
MSAGTRPFSLAATALAMVIAFAPQRAHADEAAATAASPPPARAESKMSSPGLVAGGAAVGLFGLGATGLGVYLTAKGSTLDCIQCEDSNENAPLVAGGLTTFVLGLGMAAAGGTMVILGLRDAPGGVRVAEVHVQPGGATLVGSF